MRNAGIARALWLTSIAAMVLGGPGRMGPIMAAQDDKIAILDACDPTDPAWAATGGCALKKGDVTRDEAGALLFSPLSSATIGHPAWRNEPSFLTIEPNKTVRVTNKGGEVHTFTEVAAFGGGRIPGLNQGLTSAPECAAAVDLAPGAGTEVTGLGEGNHLFMCCIHPWMRALIKVKPKD